MERCSGRDGKEMRKFMNFLRDEEGATAIEYSLLAALIAVVMIAGATAVGNKVNGTFNTVASRMP